MKSQFYTSAPHGTVKRIQNNANDIDDYVCLGPTSLMQVVSKVGPTMQIFLIKNF